MTIRLDLTGLKKTKWYDYGIRFAFGGTITVITGILSQKFGPAVGGLFLAFPAILPASATLVEKHNSKNKAEADTIGAAMGSIGLVCFAVSVWALAEHIQPWLVLLIATLVWLVVSVCVWLIIKKIVR